MRFFLPFSGHLCILFVEIIIDSSQISQQLCMYSHIIYLAICCDFFLPSFDFTTSLSQSYLSAGHPLFKYTLKIPNAFSKLQQHVCISGFFFGSCELSQLRADSDDEKIDRKKNDKIIECHRAKTIMFMINEVFFYSSLNTELVFAYTESAPGKIPNVFSNEIYEIYLFIYFGEFFFSENENLIEIRERTMIRW